ncbi:MAG: TIGR02281 family clan AA aspartic protease [Leptolyngbyaceae cyanobacterium]
MPACFSPRCFSLLLVGGCVLSGCTFLSGQTPSLDSQTEIERPDESANAGSEPTAETESGTESSAATTAESEVPTSPSRDFYSEGVSRAQSAVTIGQSAQSPDDWKLVESRWNQAALLMQRVPDSDPNHATAQQKVSEYQQNASQAAQKATEEVSASSAPVVDNSSASGLVAEIPIVRRISGIPVVPVTLTGNQTSQQFTMLFDTGASGTLITPAMARSIGVLVVGEATVTVADGRNVQIPIGYVDTLEVGGLVVRDLVVGIGGDVALLGQDVYGQYGISAGGSSINLYQ